MPKKPTANNEVVQAHGAPSDAAPMRQASKLQTIISLLRRPEGAVIEELISATSWQKHSVRGAISGALKKKQNLAISSTLIEGRGRVYHIETQATAEVAPAATTDENGLEARS